MAAAPAAAAAAGEDAAPRGDASRAADRGRTGAEVRDGTLSGTGGERTNIFVAGTDLMSC